VSFYWKCGKCGRDGLPPQTAVAVFEPWAGGVRVRHFECLRCKPTSAARLIDTITKDPVGSEVREVIERLVARLGCDHFFRLLYEREGKPFPDSLKEVSS
jgi:hypothetical protein